MNYYIQGDAAKAEQIKAAFEKLGYDISWPGGCANPDVINIGVDRNGVKYVVAETSEYIKDIIKTHPDYEELELHVEPKVKVGDWLYHNTYGARPILVKGYSKRKGYKVECIRTTYYLQKDVIENEYHFWTIADAKDGDVLADDKKIVIFSKFEEPTRKQSIMAYAGLDLRGELQITKDTKDSWRLAVDRIRPATKEQRDLLFAKMQEAGYQWDEKKKELRKIQPHYDIKNFKPFDKVLVRDGDIGVWNTDLFSSYDDNFYCFRGTWEQCIPYNDDTKHLLGTTDMPSEEYINW